MYKRMIWWAITLGAVWMGYWLGRELERQRQATQAERVDKLVHWTGGAINE